MTRIRLRRSTIALTAFFVLTLAAYLVLRPTPPGPHAGTGHQHQPGPGGPVVIHPAHPGAVELLPGAGAEDPHRHAIAGPDDVRPGRLRLVHGHPRHPRAIGFGGQHGPLAQRSRTLAI